MSYTYTRMADYDGFRVPVNLVFDFDGTITCNDTTAILGRITAHSRSKWDQVLDGYLHDHQKFSQTFFDWRNYSRHEFSRWLESRRWVEEASALRAQKCGMFKGVSMSDIKAIVNSRPTHDQIRLRSGWIHLLQLVAKNLDSSQASIVSVNWSSAFILEVIYSAAVKSDCFHRKGGSNFTDFVSNLEIFANEVQGLSSPCGSSGRIVRPFGVDLRTSRDKCRYFEWIVSHSNARQSSHQSQRSASVYIGDSITDFDCLVKADIGIWLQDVPEDDYEDKFREIFRPLREAPLPLTLLQESDLNPDRLTSRNDHLNIYWAPNFETITSVLACRSQTSTMA